MDHQSTFAVIPPKLEEVFQQLRQHEPIFHTDAFGRTRAQWEHSTAPDYWEVGASGRRYTRDFILDQLEKSPPVHVATAGWSCTDFGLRQIGPQVYLLTYTLHQRMRVTRRSSLWERAAEGWRILFHQGTIVRGDDNTLPLAEERLT
jgi:hypothetical protein